MKRWTYAGWLLLFGGLFALLQAGFHYHFYYIEQNQLFLFTREFFIDKLALPGGLACWIAEFLVQFFLAPYVGAAITAALLTATGIAAARLIRQATGTACPPLAALLPVITLLFMHFDFNYRVQGTVAFLLMEGALCGYLSIRGARLRAVAGVVGVPLLFWLAGAVAILFAVMACLLEWVRREKGALLSGIVLAEALLLGLLSVRFVWFGEYRQAFLPDLYYHYKLHPAGVIYLAWASLPLALFLSCLLRRWGETGNKRIKGWIYGIQGLLLAVLLYWGIPQYSDTKSLRLKELDYYARTGQWDRIIATSRGNIKNYLYLCHLNMALAQRGELADRMFAFDQRGPKGLIVEWNKSENISSLLSDIHFTTGATAAAQQMAFEGYVSTPNDGNPRLLQRLVQTNLIYGAYPVAEKYISLLEKTWGYKAWATRQRRFLHNEQAIAADPVLGTRRRMLPETDAPALLHGLSADLETIARQAGAPSAALQYLGASMLLAKDLQAFQALVEKYYGSALLPVLPRHFQEAVIVLSEKTPDYWKRFAVPQETVRRFAAYKQQVLAQRQNPRLAHSLYPAFGNTYWFYYMFK